MGLFCRLKPGDTARRLNSVGSKSSSRRRLPSVFRVNSPPAAAAAGCGVEERDGDEWLVLVGNSGTLGAVVEVGVSMAKSSLTDELALRGNGGGGVLILSSKLFQKSGPVEFRKACVEKLTEGLRSPGASRPMMSVNSSIASICAGEDAAVTFCEGPVVDSGLGSLSRTCRMTSASRRLSLSTGETSSCNAARTRANIFGLGCQEINFAKLRGRA